MAGRTVEIKITGYEYYTAIGEELGERINELANDNVEFIKEELTEMTGKERQEIYEWLNTVFRCRM